jgi:hypothetical protein
VEARGATLSVFRLNSPPADQSQPAVEGSPRRLRPTTATLAASQTPVNTSTPAQPSRPPGLARPAPPANASGFVLRGDHWTTPNVQSSTATGSSLVPLSTSAHRSPSPEATNPGQHNSSHQYSQLNSHRTDVAAMRAQTSSPRSWSPPLDSQVTLNERRSPFATRSLSKNIPDKNRETPSASTPPDLETSPVQAPVFGVRHQNSPMTAQYSAAVHHRQSPPSDDAEQPAPIPSRSNAQAHQSPFEAHRNSSSSEHTRSATPAESHQAHFAPAAEARQSHSAPVAESHQSPSAPANSSSSSSSSSGHSSSSSGKGH